MQPISSLSAVSMSPSKSLATQRNGALFNGVKRIATTSDKQNTQVVNALVQEKMPKITNTKLLKTLKSLLSEALSSKELNLRLDARNFTFNIGGLKYCFPYNDSILPRLNAVLKFRQPKES